MKQHVITVQHLKDKLNVKPFVDMFKFRGPPLRLRMKFGIEIALY